jgi:hypothetical protein
MYSFTSGYLGDYSSLKFQLLINFYNLNMDELVQPGWAMKDGNFYRIMAWGKGFNAYLMQMEADGHPVYEADGVTPMTMGPYSR